MATIGKVVGDINRHGLGHVLESGWHHGDEIENLELRKEWNKAQKAITKIGKILEPYRT